MDLQCLSHAQHRRTLRWIGVEANYMADCVNKRRVARLKVITECWREHCNKVRPHSSLGYRSPAPEVLVPASKLILRATLN